MKLKPWREVRQRAALEDLVREYAEHQSWRCGHPDRYPWDRPELGCPCGLVGALRDAGLPLSWAGDPDAIAAENRKREGIES